jgi:hypothetical protein
MLQDDCRTPPQGEGGEVMKIWDKGPWSVNDRGTGISVESEDFTHDVPPPIPLYIPFGQIARK